MALNPPLNENGDPFRVDNNECFILQRKGIEFEVKVEGLGKMTGKGKVSKLWFIFKLFSACNDYKQNSPD